MQNKFFQLIYKHSMRCGTRSFDMKISLQEMVEESWKRKW